MSELFRGSNSVMVWVISSFTLNPEDGKNASHSYRLTYKNIVKTLFFSYSYRLRVHSTLRYLSIIPFFYFTLFIHSSGNRTRNYYAYSQILLPICLIYNQSKLKQATVKLLWIQLLLGGNKYVIFSYTRSGNEAKRGVVLRCSTRNASRIQRIVRCGSVLMGNGMC